jgi:O-methyltransferase involved in polyketide biosynthesis
VSTAHPARIWNYWLGGRDYFPADQAAGDTISGQFPHVAAAARAQRAFGVRALRFLAGAARIRQFLDVGAGLPAGGNTHEIVQRIAPDSGIVYVDNDPAVILHAKALLDGPGSGPGSAGGVVSYAEADLRDVSAVLAGAAATLDLAKPVALVMLGVLGHIDDYGAARSIVSHLMDALPAGSYLAIADGVTPGAELAGTELAGAELAGAEPTGAELAGAQQRYNRDASLPYHLRRPDELVSFFDGLALVEPGVVPCSRWRPDGAVGVPSGEAPAYCGVARKGPVA